MHLTEKSTEWSQNELARFKVKKYPYGYYIKPWGPNVYPIQLAITHFRVMSQFCEKCTEWPQNDFDMSKDKNTNTHAAYIQEAQTFIRFTLQWAVSSYAAFFGKCTEWPKMTLTCSRSKIPKCILHIQPMPKFSSVSLCDDLFSSYAAFFQKSGQNDPKMTWHVHTKMHTTYRIEAQIVICFVLRWDVFELYPLFRKSAPNDPQMALACWRSKVSICIVYIPGSYIFVRFTLRWAVFEEFEFFYFPIGYNVKIIFLITQNFNKNILWGPQSGDCGKSLVATCKNFKTVEGVAFWNFHSNSVPCQWKLKSCVKKTFLSKFKYHLGVLTRATHA